MSWKDKTQACIWADRDLDANELVSLPSGIFDQLTSLSIL